VIACRTAEKLVEAPVVWKKKKKSYVQERERERITGGQNTQDTSKAAM
jgi:hypothetical protein